jgi:hypothetical protein
VAPSGTRQPLQQLPAAVYSSWPVPPPPRAHGSEEPSVPGGAGSDAIGGSDGGSDGDLGAEAESDASDGDREEQEEDSDRPITAHTTFNLQETDAVIGRLAEMTVNVEEAEEAAINTGTVDEEVASRMRERSRHVEQALATAAELVAVVSVANIAARIDGDATTMTASFETINRQI